MQRVSHLMKKLSQLALFLSHPVIVFALLVLAWGTPRAVEKGDPARGKITSDTCMGCHGIRGYRNAYPSYSVPRLQGQHAKYIIAALKAYQSGARAHKTMHVNAIALTDQEIVDIAAYLSSATAKD